MWGMVLGKLQLIYLYKYIEIRILKKLIMTADVLRDLAFKKFHQVEMLFLPSAWKSAKNSSRTWKSCDFPPVPKKLIPKASGVYVFVVQPNLFDFEHSHGLLYIGKAKNLNERISSYIGEIGKDLEKTTRPYPWLMIKLWNSYLKYHFTVTTNVAEAEELEKEMINAFRPPFNKRFYAEVSKEMRAFG